MKRPRSFYTKRYPNTNVQGFEAVMLNLNTTIAKMKIASERGLLEAAYFIRHETEEKADATPLDYGNLRASWFTTWSKGVAKDPLRLSGRFKNNKRKKLTASQFQTWHTQATAEASGMSAANPRKATVVMGYSANYAMWVHEMIGAEYTPRGPAAGPKWFEKAIDRNRGKLIEIIRQTSKSPIK